MSDKAKDMSCNFVMAKGTLDPCPEYQSNVFVAQMTIWDMARPNNDQEDS